MLIFKNKEKGTHFAVNNSTNEVIYMYPRELGTLHKFSALFGGLEYLELPNLKTVQQFRKLTKTGILQNVPYIETRQYFLQNYPELFI